MPAVVLKGNVSCLTAATNRYHDGFTVRWRDDSGLEDIAPCQERLSLVGFAYLGWLSSIFLLIASV